MLQRFRGYRDDVTKPPYSIDLVIDRVHIVAGNINEMTHVIRENGQVIANKGDTVVEHFNVNFAKLSENVTDMVSAADDKFASFPLSILYTLLIVALIAIFLAMVFLAIYSLHKFTSKKYRTLDSPQPSEISVI
ncbi:unnamed protein product [Bursaphelenchus okinawaensis]|uniref:Uncharacterized protein n=1 Tax=Bursaphelenchus okinawaensis TaxID=465554 RepID=A0A811L8W8_9BILA|nr:unnamed protein product [Bursaphelenchus okinawaensis]CAG9119305.1 unnamed protein product [Bursaphelenchus okinawaensis]